MDQNHSDKPDGAPACAQNAGAGVPSGGAGPERRNSARRKLAAVTRLLRGEPLETVARELNLTVARLSEWRDRALVAAEAAMKGCGRDGRDEELLRLALVHNSWPSCRTLAGRGADRRLITPSPRFLGCGTVR